MSLLRHAPRFDAPAAVEIAHTSYGLDATATPLPSERDQNFLLQTTAGERFVLKIANATERRDLLEAQNAALAHVAGRTDFCPRPVPARSGETILTAGSHLVRLVTWLPGRTLAETREHSPALLESLGERLGVLDAGLATFDHPAARRDFYWDLARGPRTIRERLALVEDAARRGFVIAVLQRIEGEQAQRLSSLRRSVIHNDANDHNVLVSDQRVTGLIDFGDMVHSITVADPAVAMAYAILDTPEPLGVMATIARGYQRHRPFSADELVVLFDLVCLRLSMSICIAADQQRQRPDDEYLAISQAAIRRTVPRLAGIAPRLALSALRDGCAPGPRRAATDETLAKRRALIGPNVTLSYADPIKLVRGWMQYVYDAAGRRYLDAYNNVPHVGHAHPRVTAAVEQQMRALNTNTRYLHDNPVMFAERLTATLPDPLRVCYFLNSGSEANELALRLARTHTRQRDVIVLDAAYHGHTTTLIDISPYKFNGPGGSGRPDWVHVVPVPDVYRGDYRNEADAGRRFAEAVGDVLRSMRAEGRGPAAFIAETCPSVGGQIVPPAGYLDAVYRQVRAAGGVCIADEVQTAYGRMGTAFYAFEDQHVVPDIVVLGKPIGNGYPLGAVVTTADIAASFDNGMEFFSTFGGSTVSCAAGLAVLDVVQDDDLQAHAARVGARLLDALRPLRDRHALVGDVRGSGFFLGVELVKNRATREPAGSEATRVVNRLREEGILIGTDGPFHNVLKIRPPMPFDMADADLLAATLDRVLSETA